MHDFIVKSETFRCLLRLRRQFLNLPYDEFPCRGAEKIWKLLHEIVEIIISRLDRYSTRQIQLINALLPQFELFCGILSDSRIENVPWSIIPSLEMLFSEIRPESKFVITPKWEFNYAIMNRNVIGYLDKIVLSVKGLLFDADDDFEVRKQELLKNIDKEVYIVFYPRSERLSVLQFPILGHEIGHIFASQWIENNFKQFVERHNIEIQLQEHIKTNIPGYFLGTLFEEQLKMTLFAEYIEVYRNVLCELISDFIGIIIFGHTALLSSYIFAIKSGLDNQNAIQYGYLPWRFRLYFLKKVLDGRGVHVVNGRHHQGLKLWFEEIDKKIAELDLKQFERPANRYNYLKYLIDTLDLRLEQILESVQGSIPLVSFEDVYEYNLESAVYERLSDDIIPNCLIDNNLNERPIDLRNIVAGTWLYICERRQDNFKEFVEMSNTANLLSLKGIELSHIQSKVKCQ